METNEAEEWRVIPSFPDYEASSWGRVRRRVALKHWPAGYIMRQKPHPKTKYVLTSLTRVPGEYVSCLVHRLVAEAFIGDPGGLHVNHIDFNPENNRPDNLEYVTQSENLLHSGRAGRIGRCNALLSNDQVFEIRELLKVGGRGLPGRIAAKFGVDRKTITSIRDNLTWRWLSSPNDLANTGDVV